MKKLIINTDDFGLTEGVNRSVIESHLYGVVTSATLMCNMWAFDHAIHLAKKFPSLGVGIHLTLAAGKPLLNPNEVPTIVDRQGDFRHRSDLIKRLLIGKISLSEIEAELRAQIEKFINSGLQPTHVDGDQHCHILPGINKIVVRLAKELDVPLRIPDERIIRKKMTSQTMTGHILRQISAKMLMKFLSKRMKSMCKKKSVKTNDYFLSIFGLIPNVRPKIEHFKILINCAQDGINELMVHPGYYDKRLATFWHGGEAQAKEREDELHCLLSPELKKIIREQGIILSNYCCLLDLE